MMRMNDDSSIKKGIRFVINKREAIYKYFNVKTIDTSVLKQLSMQIIRNQPVIDLQKIYQDLGLIDFKSTKIYKKNQDKFNETILKPNIINEIKKLLKLNETQVITPSNVPDELKDVYNIKSSINISHVEDALSNSYGFCKFVYDWDNDNLNAQQIDWNYSGLQKVSLTIHVKHGSYFFPAVLNYKCQKCGHEHSRNFTDVEGGNLASICPNVIPIAGGKTKVCNTRIASAKTNESVEIFLYEASYFTENGVKESRLVESLVELENKKYEVVGLKYYAGDYNAAFIILDKKEIPRLQLKYKHIIKPKEQPRPPDDKENFIPKIIDFIDDAIQKATGEKIVGMYNIKFAFIIQMMIYILKIPEKHGHIMISGQNDTGKTYVIENYGKFLFGSYFKTTNGNSVSLAGLRGSAVSNRDISKGNKNRLGLLSMYKSIYIDEINENPELLETLKSMMLTPKFSNDTASGDKISYDRVAQICCAENPSLKHVQEYIKKVHDEYNRQTENRIKQEGEDDMEIAEEWNSKWDLFQPIFSYHNPYLQKALQKVRDFYYNSGASWLDGAQQAVNDRFMFYFHLKRDPNAKENDEKNTAIMLGAMKQVLSHTTSEERENQVYDNVEEFFQCFTQYKQHEMSEEETNAAIEKIKEMIIAFGFKNYGRIYKNAVMLLDICRMLNKRLKFNETDFKMVRLLFLSKERRTDINEMNALDTILYMFDERKPESKIDVVNNNEHFDSLEGEYEDME